MHASIVPIESVTLAELFSIICYRRVVPSGEFVVYPYRHCNAWPSLLFLSIDSVNVRLSIMLWSYRWLVCEYWLYIIGFQYIVLLVYTRTCTVMRSIMPEMCRLYIAQQHANIFHKSIFHLMEINTNFALLGSVDLFLDKVDDIFFTPRYERWII